MVAIKIEVILRTLMLTLSKIKVHFKDAGKPTNQLTTTALQDMAQVLMLFTDLSHHRVTIAAQGGVSLLLYSFSSENEKARLYSAAGIARLCISLNPISFPENQVTLLYIYVSLI